MPAYDYDCPDCGRVEVILAADDADYERPCVRCGKTADFVWPLVHMQPDSYWSGKFVPAIGKEFSSKTQLKQYLDRNDLTISGDGDSGVSTTQRRRAEENWKLKTAKPRREAIVETVKEMV